MPTSVTQRAHTRARTPLAIDISRSTHFFVQDDLDLILRRDTVSVEAIYLSRHAATSAAAALSAASLLDKTPRVTLKVMS